MIMKRFIALFFALLLGPYASPALAQDGPAEGSCAAWLDHTVDELHSSDQLNLCTLTANKPALLVNTASYCGFTYQFEGLETLYQRYKDQGLAVVGFPSDDFDQEADDEATTAEVCYENYGVSFPMSQTLSVASDDAHPVFQHLAAEQGKPEWNFNKFLVDADGQVVERFPSSVEPDSEELARAIENLL